MTLFFEKNQGVVTSKKIAHMFMLVGLTNLVLRRTFDVTISSATLSLCRPEKELHEKIHNIGHSDLVEKDPFIKSMVHRWENYHELHNFKNWIR